MSKLIDLLAIAGAVGVVGYFAYKVILPNLQNITLPSLQLPPFPTLNFNFGAPPSQYGTAPTTPTPSTPSTPPPGAGALLYDSNIHGKWNNGVKRVVTAGEGGQGPDGKGLHTAASGNPVFTIDGNGVAHLESSRYGRVYIYAKNYNARLEGEMMFETKNNGNDNLSIKMRSRHNHSGHSTAGGGNGNNNCGGIGTSYHVDGHVELSNEPQHGTNGKMGGGNMASQPGVNTWHKFAFSVWDDDNGSSISSKSEFDGKTVATGKWSGPASQCKTKSLFDADSYFWLRLNSYGGRAKVAVRNLKLYELGASQQQQQQQYSRINMMKRQPYIYNSFYNRRRL